VNFGHNLLATEFSLISSTIFFSETLLIIRRTDRVTAINVHSSSFEVPVILTKF